MKKAHLFLLAMLVLSVAAVLAISPIKAAGHKTFSQTGSIPDSVAKVLRNSCASCHNDGGNVMAMSKWSLSKWDTYSADKQAKKASSICDAMTKGKMPPNSVRKSTPEKIPTTAQIDMVCKWANSLNVKK
ncbi:MAG: heme-binding domain-containing protein [Bacteroidales bacterium]|jgi:uncharacterized membrane protein